MHYIAEFCAFDVKNFFPGNDTPGSPQKRPRCLDPDTISAWLDSVPVVPVLRFDHCVSSKMRQVIEEKKRGNQKHFSPRNTTIGLG